MKVLLAAGGTAGHIEPALNLADLLTDADPSTEVVFVASRGAAGKRAALLKVELSLEQGERRRREKRQEQERERERGGVGDGQGQQTGEGLLLRGAALLGLLVP